MAKRKNSGGNLTPKQMLEAKMAASPTAAKRAIPLVHESLDDVIERARRRHEANAIGPIWEEDAAQHEIARLAAMLPPRYSPARATLNEFAVYDEKRQRPALDALHKVLADLPGWIKSGRGLVLYGSCGTGKDHLLAWLLYSAAALGFRCSWVNVQDLMGESRDRMKGNEVEGRWIRNLGEPDILVLSELVPNDGDLSHWNLGLLYRIVGRRNNLLRCTWGTANTSSNEPKEAEKELKHALTVPVWDRLRERAMIVPCFWESHRGRT